MKALTIWQPWASLIGVKLIETRSWRTNYRGPLLICSAVKNDATTARALARREIQVGLAHNLGDTLFPGPHGLLDFGHALAVVDLVDCLPVEELADSVIRRELPFGDFSDGRFGWMLANVRKIKPFPVTGRQGLFSVDTRNLIEELA